MAAIITKDPFEGLWQSYEEFNKELDVLDPIRYVLAYYEKDEKGVMILKCEKAKTFALPLTVCTDYKNSKETKKLQKAITERRVILLREEIFEDGLPHSKKTTPIKFFTLYLSEMSIKDVSEINVVTELSIKLSKKVVKIESNTPFSIQTINQETFKILCLKGFLKENTSSVCSIL